MSHHISWLTKFRIADLQRLAVALGTPYSGTKSTRAQGILDSLSIANLKSSDPASASFKRTDHGPDEVPLRLVSIDMGVRNLAYAVFSECPSVRTTSKSQCATGYHASIPKVRFEAWKKVDVTAIDANGADDIDSSTLNKSKVSSGSSTQRASTSCGEAKVVTEADSYHPSSYAKQAYSVINSILQTYRPTHIIIERQRFRSGGSSAVLEWTLRVGVFEGMLWAVLQTLREESSKTSNVSQNANAENDLANIEVEAILPPRVNRFWLEDCSKTRTGDSNPDSTGVAITRDMAEVSKKASMKGKDMKRAKIAIASNILSKIDGSSRSNLQSSPMSSVPDFPQLIPLSISPDASKMVQRFQAQHVNSSSLSSVSPPGPLHSPQCKTSTKLARSRRSHSTKDEPATGPSPEDLSSPTDNMKLSKLDDLADCFLQGLAWLNWRANRRVLAEKGPDVLSTMIPGTKEIVEDSIKNVSTTTKKAPRTKSVRAKDGKTNKSRRMKGEDERRMSRK